MKVQLAFVVALVAFLAVSARAASDADVTIIKAKKVVIEEGVITIVAEAKTSITLIQGDSATNDRQPSL